jgi:predicted DCC family thiol-disulfide oxidoreductase YuxK
MMKIRPNYVVLYDGVCGLCNGVVQNVLKFDKKEEIYFSPLQTQFSKNLLKQKNIDSLDLDTFYFCELTSLKNPKIIKLSSRFNGAYSLLTLLSESNPLFLFFTFFMFFIPSFLGNLAYNFIGSRRYSIFGKHEEICKKFEQKELKRFIFD